jgi:lysozyme family protein
MSHFPRCIKHVLAAEGGYVNDPNDPGGETKFGISKRSYPDLDIQLITQDQAIALYERDFWTPIQGDALPAGLDLLILDHGINAGTKPAVRLLQGLTGAPADGIMGPITLASISGQDTESLITRFSTARLAYYESLSGWRYYAAGWRRRVQRMQRLALAMAREVLAP